MQEHSFSRRAYCIYCVFSWSLAAVFVDGSDYVSYVVGFEELSHLLVEIFSALIRSYRFRMGSELDHQSAVCIDEVILMREEFDVFCAGCCAYEYDKVLVSSS